MKRNISNLPVKRCRLILHKCLQVPLQALLPIVMIQNSVLRLHAVENGEIYGISDINFTIASFAANGHAKHSLPSVGKPTAPLGQRSSFVPRGLR